MYTTSKIRSVSKSTGFTLVETIVAITIGVMVAMFVMTIAVETLKTTTEIKHSERLHVDVMHITNKLSYFVKQSRRIEESDDFSGFTLFILKFNEEGDLLGEDEVEIKHEDGSILIDDDSVSDNDSIMSENVEITVFEVKKVESSVRIVFNIKYSGGDKEYGFVTTLSSRN